MEAVYESSPKISWKDKLLGINPRAIDKEELGPPSADAYDDLEFIEEHIHRIQKLLFKEMELMIVLKLLGRNIGLPGLPSFLYKNKIIEEIGATIGKVVLLDFNTDSRIRGRFARMAVYINLDKPLVARVLVNDRNHRVEYEALPTIFFSCGKYSHTKELCDSIQSVLGSEKIVVDRNNQHNSRDDFPNRVDIKGKGKSGSHFGVEDLGKKLNKGTEGELAEFQGRLKGANLNADSALTSKPISSVSKPIEVQVVNYSGDLSPTKHTAVTFKEKGSADGVNLEKVPLLNSGDSKTRIMGKIMGGKEEGFRATRKIKKIPYRKGNNIKIKNSSKLPLSGSMSMLAQSISALHSDDPGAGDSSVGKRILILIVMF
ncbi:hypothetical protein PVK06_040003 [Gossypium arboreum]|uniref:Uncharacterized protein n=1 Tax=Gossypium arboreum TaxID=29729 RepID=A0ABR0N4E2_GOSAR|nr:hypothetical protein PVK06_040003 [Gossypium arboreum]